MSFQKGGPEFRQPALVATVEADNGVEAIEQVAQQLGKQADYFAIEVELRTVTLRAN